MKKQHLIGKRFGKLIVLEDAAKLHSKDRLRYRCLCDCGNIIIVSVGELRKNKTKSCGCLRKEFVGNINKTHGESKKSAEYNSWMAMKQRCFYNKHQYYRLYGDRGIVVCNRWKDSFENFLVDVGRRPSPKHSLDRYPDNNGNYEPGNVRWATNEQQANNQRGNRLIEHEGVILTISQWTKKLNITNGQMSYWLYQKKKTISEIIENFQPSGITFAETDKL